MREEEPVSFQVWRRALVVGLLSITTFISGLALIARAQEESTRKVQTRISPEYPPIARRMKIGGVVKVQLMVAPNGAVKDAKVVGGHPLLGNAVLDAVRKWHYEPRPQATTENLEFRFDPTQ
jgi:TonB family protein